MTWYHPSYYRKLRAERKKIPVSGTGEQETAPSDNLNAENSKRFVDQASSAKAQAASVKLRPKPQALKCKLSPPKPKVQAPSPE